MALVCDENEYDNTASFVTNDTDTEGEDTWTVAYSYLCPQLACGFSQGSWLVSGSIVWPVEFILLGGFEYDEAESKAMFPPDTTPKHAFTQFAALYLTSMHLGLDYPTELVDDMAIIDQFFSDAGFKFDGSNIATASQAVQDASGAIGDWIGTYPCSDDLKD